MGGRAAGGQRLGKALSLGFEPIPPEAYYVAAAQYDATDLEEQVDEQRAVIETQASKIESLRAALERAEKRAQEAARSADRANESIEAQEARREALREYWSSKERSK